MSLLTQIATQIDKSKKASENIASGKFTTDLVNAYPPEEIHLEEKMVKFRYLKMENSTFCI